jgi:hypothetical protein
VVPRNLGPLVVLRHRMHSNHITSGRKSMATKTAAKKAPAKKPAAKKAAAKKPAAKKAVAKKAAAPKAKAAPVKGLLDTVKKIKATVAAKVKTAKSKVASKTK